MIDRIPEPEWTLIRPVGAHPNNGLIPLRQCSWPLVRAGKLL